MTGAPAFFAGSGIGATWNPSDKGANISLDATKTIATKVTSDANQVVRATLSRVAATDEGYFEVYIANGDTSPFIAIGLANSTLSLNSFVGADTNSWGYYEQTGQKYTNNVPSAYGAAYLAGDLIGVALMNGSLWFAKNNVWQNSGVPGTSGAAFTGLTGSLFPAANLFRASAGPSQVGLRLNAGLQTYSPPSGFLPWDR